MSRATENLDHTQKVALDLFRDGRSIALIGGGGTGKSFLLKKIIAQAEERIGKFPIVAACAHSNKAAEALNGVTIHKLFGAKPSWEFSKEYLLKGIKSKPKLCDQLSKIEVLVIDEISLLTSNVLDAIDHVLRYFSPSEWHSSLPLGGRQLVLSGDPFQLEPYKALQCLQIDALRTAYQSRTWYLNFGAPGDGVVINLKSNHRQSKDPQFFSMLNRIRVGTQTTEDIARLNSLGGTERCPLESYTRLCLTNEQVSRINGGKLSTLQGPFFRLESVDKFLNNDQSNLGKRLDGVAPRVVSLKIGAHVIITRKIESSEGTLLPGAKATVRSVERLRTNDKRLKFAVIVEIMEFSEDGNSTEVAREGLTGRLVRIPPATFEVHRFDRTVIAKREQVPLIPAYALTIHRSQGMTFSRVAINFNVASNWKPCGMAYVALSRCTSTSGLWVTGLRSNHISVSKRAKDVMKDLWKLHVHEPSRIRGVTEPSCLNLSQHDVADDICAIQGAADYDGTIISSSQPSSTDDALVRQDILDQSVTRVHSNENVKYSVECRPAGEGHVLHSDYHAEEARSYVKRTFDSIRSADENESDIEVMFVRLVKRRKSTSASEKRFRFYPGRKEG